MTPRLPAAGYDAISRAWRPRTCGLGWTGMGIGNENWNLAVYRDPRAASEAAADVVSAVIRGKPDAAISFPTGSTPLGMFDVLAARAARAEIDFSGITVFCLDEYVGVTVEDPNSLTRWLKEALLDRIGISADQLKTLPVTAHDLSAAAASYDEGITVHGGLDFAILGLGPNGHIGYNEPGSRADSRTRVITLTPQSISQASAYWEGTVPIPHQAMTMGVATLLEAKQLVLLVIGEAKAAVLRRTLEDPMSVAVPASWLRIAGPRLTVIADEAAASGLSNERLGWSEVPDDRGGESRD
jgi:glucosamine-6-phosphate deaminase